MKRTAEIILSVVGILFYVLLAALGGTMLFLQNNEEFLQEIKDQESQIGINDIDTLIEGMNTGGWLFIVTSILAIILGIVAIFLIKGNKRPKSAGIIYIVVSVLAAIITIGFGIIPGIFYLIAGIMGLVRKPTQQI
ncbi:DUF4064 domain-containing protein [Lentibacillus salinarum]|uniref:DUF4064 domain-containing protein n=1 Tax=Lentibacillus salinarum TaxID=446820 RepID=A0ABW3ZYB3_9BACI